MDELISDFQKIDQARCEAMLLAISKAGLTKADEDSLLKGLWIIYKETNTKVEKLLGDFTADTRVLYRDDFASGWDLSRLAASWGIYGYGALLGQRWWGAQAPQNRQGDYGIAGISLNSQGLLSTMNESYDESGKRVLIPASKNPSQLPTYTATYLVQDSSTSRGYLPQFFDVSVRCWFDEVEGHWIAPLWFTAADGGSKVFEIDGMEWFPNRPQFSRFAVHATFDGDSAVTFNIGNGGMLGPQEVNTSIATGQSTGKIHEWRTRCEPYGENHLLLSWFCDGKLMRQQTTEQIEVKNGKKLSSAIARSRAGWKFHICSQPGGAGGPVGPRTNGARFCIQSVEAREVLV